MIDIDDVLEATGAAGTTLNRDALARLWEAVGNHESWARDEFIEAVQAICSPIWDGDGPPPPDQLAFRFGRWHIDVAETGVKVALLTAIASTLIVAGIDTDLSSAVVAGILPAALTIRRKEISAGDRSITLEIRATEAFRTGWATPETLYESLHDDTKRTLNRHDFADFVARLRELGLVDGDDDWIRLQPPDDRD